MKRKGVRLRQCPLKRPINNEGKEKVLNELEIDIDVERRVQFDPQLDDI